MSDAPVPPPVTRPIWLWTGPFVTLITIIVGTIAIGGKLGAVKPSADRLVYEVSGKGTTVLEHEFTVEDEWEIKWEKAGVVQEIRWTRRDGHSQCFMAIPSKPIRDHGSVNISDGGVYRLSIVADGPWTLRVFRLGDSRAHRAETKLQ